MQFIMWWYNVYSLHDICVLQQAWVGCRLARCDNQDLGNYCDMDEEQWIVSHNAVYGNMTEETFEWLCLVEMIGSGK